MRTDRPALLVDLENVLHVGDTDDPGCDRYWADPAEADLIMAWVLGEAGPVGFSLCACAPSSLDRYLGASEFPHWLPLRLVADGVRDAADDYLLAEGGFLLGLGFRRFCLASGDGAFCALAEAPGVSATVLVHHLRSLSRRLELASSGLRVFAAPAAPGARPARAA